MPRNIKPERSVHGSIYDRKVADFFENWIVESGIKMKFNTVTYYIERQALPPPKNPWDHLLQYIGLRVPDNYNIMYVVTNLPGALIGRGGELLNRYRAIFTDKSIIQGIDHVEIVEVKSQENLWKGVKWKSKEFEAKKNKNKHKK